MTRHVSPMLSPCSSLPFRTYRLRHDSPMLSPCCSLPFRTYRPHSARSCHSTPEAGPLTARQQGCKAARQQGCLLPEHASHQKGVREGRRCLWKHARERHRDTRARAQGTKGQVGNAAPPRTWQLKAPAFLGIMFLLGATVGPLVDGIHGHVHLLQYDSAPLELGPLHSSAWVFALLGAFYAVLGALYVLLDSAALNSGPAAGSAPWLSRWAAHSTDAAVDRASAPYAALALGVVALLHQVSSVMYAAGVPYRDIGLTLASLAALNWAAFDRTPQGLLLAALCGVAAPISEIVLMAGFGVWHYDRPDVMVAGVGLPSWVCFCYFFYNTWLAAASRLLWKRL